MDVLIDSTSGHGMLSFMDGFSGYNQIKMAIRDAEKTAFRIPYGNFYYTVMPFGLKNAGATYQRTMTAVFLDMMGKEVEDYVDDLVVKSKTRKEHWSTLKGCSEGEEGFDVSQEILGELPEISAVVEEEGPWTLHFDGSATSNGGGVGVVPLDPKGHAKPFSFKLNFSCTNNVAE
ncbi:hypothetical protein ACLB2K_040529 [Fragaria x ananassa]